LRFDLNTHSLVPDRKERSIADVAEYLRGFRV